MTDVINPIKNDTRFFKHHEKSIMFFQKFKTPINKIYNVVITMNKPKFILIFQTKYMKKLTFLLKKY